MPNNTIEIFGYCDLLVMRYYLSIIYNNSSEIFEYCDLLVMRYYLSIIYNNSSLMTFNVIIGGISGRNGQ